MENMAQKIFLDESDLEIAVENACACLKIAECETKAKFGKYASLKSVAFTKGKTITFKASDAFKSASHEVLLGLALHLLAKLFRKSVPPEFEKYVQEYKLFTASEAVHKLDNSLRVLRERPKKLEPVGETYDLNQVIGKVAAEYWNVLDGIELPRATWTSAPWFRTLGLYDDAFNTIYVSKALDDNNVPRFVLEYVVFHELLHAKHRPKYARGRSLRRTVHTREFKAEEEKFAFFRQANEWIDRKFAKTQSFTKFV